MTYLEQLIKANVEQAAVQTISASAQRIAEEFVREIMKDKEFKKEFIKLAREMARNTITSLSKENL